MLLKCDEMDSLHQSLGRLICIIHGENWSFMKGCAIIICCRTLSVESISVWTRQQPSTYYWTYCVLLKFYHIKIYGSVIFLSFQWTYLIWSRRRPPSHHPVSDRARRQPQLARSISADAFISGCLCWPSGSLPSKVCTHTNYWKHVNLSSGTA